MATGIVQAKGSSLDLIGKEDVSYNLQCQSCSIMKSEFQVLVNEIKSMIEIISILKEDLKYYTTTSHEWKLNSTCTRKPARSSSYCCKCLDLETQLKDTLSELSSMKLITDILNEENKELKQATRNDAITNGTWIDARSRGPHGPAIVQPPNVAPSTHEIPTTHEIPVARQYSLPTANRYDALSNRQKLWEFSD